VAFPPVAATLVRPAEFGRQLGGEGRGTLARRLDPDDTQRHAETDLRRFGWTKAQRLRGVALALWMVFTSPRVPYRQVFEADDEDLQIVEVPLTVEHSHALGFVRRPTPRGGARSTRPARASARPRSRSGSSRPTAAEVATASCASFASGRAPRP
jgi:hypothetical protein